jgi:NAD(P)-dependent dehydrogenase (short-subunit alcohol dehydrogenase family)
MHRSTTVALALGAIGLAIFAAIDADPILFFSPKTGMFDGEVIWVTGASSGIGAALAKELVKHGAQVILSARRTEQLQAVADSCVGKFVPFVLPLDVTDLPAQQTAFEKIMERFGRIDSVVLNAGIVLACIWKLSDWFLHQGAASEQQLQIPPWHRLGSSSS